MANFRLDSTLQRIDRNVMQTDIDGSVVLLHIDKGKYYSLNATSSDLWRWLALPVVVQQLITKLYQKYNCSEEPAIQDTLSFLQMLHDLKLVQFID